jgi:hypothetical protein
MSDITFNFHLLYLVCSWISWTCHIQEVPVSYLSLETIIFGFVYFHWVPGKCQKVSQIRLLTVSSISFQIHCSPLLYCQECMSCYQRLRIYTCLPWSWPWQPLERRMFRRQSILGTWDACIRVWRSFWYGSCIVNVHDFSEERHEFLKGVQWNIKAVIS